MLHFSDMTYKEDMDNTLGKTFLDKSVSFSGREHVPLVLS